jgi:hypothetical protein
MPVDNIAYSDVYWTGYSASSDILLLGTDLYPNSQIDYRKTTANSTVSWKGALAHELVGHREAALKGWTQSDDNLEEVQASIRAARFTPGLSASERTALLKDAVYRLPKGVRISDIKNNLNISER